MQEARKRNTKTKEQLINFIFCTYRKWNKLIHLLEMVENQNLKKTL